MYAVPVPALSVAVTGLIKAKIVVPRRMLQGASAEQLAPTVSTVSEIAATSGAASPPVCCVQVSAPVQIYRFLPGELLRSRNTAPGEQVSGSAVPVCAGLVDGAAEKSTSWLCVCRLSLVCACRTPAASSVMINIASGREGSFDIEYSLQ